MNISCPECENRITVDESIVGKKIRCKECEHVFVVKAPKAAGKAPPAPPSKPKAAAAPPPPPKPKEEKKAPPADDGTIPLAASDPDDDKNPYALIQTNDTAPRCPFCAKEMDPPDAIICINCGYNTRTRIRKQTVAVQEVTAGDIFVHQLPAYLSILVILGLIGWNIFFWLRIPKWLKGSIFEESEGSNTYVAGCSPGFFRLYMTLFVIGLSFPLAKIVYRRLILNPKPEEMKLSNK
jgi:predicted Zn finger-like uncharacterized protein